MKTKEKTGVDYMEFKEIPKQWIYNTFHRYADSERYIQDGKEKSMSVGMFKQSVEYLDKIRHKEMLDYIKKLERIANELTISVNLLTSIK